MGAVALALALLLSPGFSYAQTTDDASADTSLLAAIRSIIEESIGELSTEIQTLRSEVQILRTELQSVQSSGGGGTSGPPPAVPLPPVPGVNLSTGDAGAEVRRLQETLIGLGFDIPAGVTGVFFSQTRDAVRALQQQYGVPVTGALDEATRELLARLAAPRPISVPPPQDVTADTPTETQPTPPPQPIITPQIRLISPQGGMFLKSGTEILINWNTSYAPAGADIVFRLTNAASGVRQLVYETEDLSGTYTWALPANMSGFNTFSAELLYDEDESDDAAPRILASRSVSIDILGDPTATAAQTNTNSGTNSGTGSSNDYRAFYTGTAFTTCMAAYPATLALIESWLDQGLLREQFPWGEITGAAANKVAECEGSTFWNDNNYPSAYGDCRNNATESACYAQSGCSWYGSYCDGNNYGGGGMSNACGGYSSQTACTADANCDWNTVSNYCFDLNPDFGPCGNYSTQTSCVAETNCHWYDDGAYEYCYYDDGTGGGGGSSGTVQMTKCFYPNATIDGTPPGYTVWCEGDYYNCRQGDENGASVPLTGLQLDAPSWCETGWDNNSAAAPNASFLANVATAIAGALERIGKAFGF